MNLPICTWYKSIWYLFDVPICAHLSQIQSHGYLEKIEQLAGNIHLVMFVRRILTITSIFRMSSLTSESAKKLAEIKNCVWLLSADGVRDELKVA